jgi:hypothetical protein
MKRPLRNALLALVPLAFVGCAQNAAPSAAAEDWLARAAEIVRASNDPDDVWDCDYVSELAIPAGWDGRLEDLSPAGENALQAMKVDAAGLGGNFVLVILEEPPRGEAYLCTE